MRISRQSCVTPAVDLVKPTYIHHGKLKLTYDLLCENLPQEMSFTMVCVTERLVPHGKTTNQELSLKCTT